MQKYIDIKLITQEEIMGLLQKLLSEYLNKPGTWKAINAFIIIFMGSLALYVLIDIVINLTSMY